MSNCCFMSNWEITVHRSYYALCCISVPSISVGEALMNTDVSITRILWSPLRAKALRLLNSQWRGAPKHGGGCEGQQERAFKSLNVCKCGTHYFPVAVLKKYLSLRPSHTCTPDSPFSLQPANSPSDTFGTRTSN